MKSVQSFIPTSIAHDVQCTQEYESGNCIAENPIMLYQNATFSVRLAFCSFFFRSGIVVDFFFNLFAGWRLICVDILFIAFILMLCVCVCVRMSVYAVSCRVRTCVR